MANCQMHNSMTAARFDSREGDTLPAFPSMRFRISGRNSLTQVASAPRPGYPSAVSVTARQ